MADEPVLLSGGNPQIPKGYGDGPVQAYIAAVPAGWKHDACRRIDALVSETLPNVQKAVKWNSPLYGMAEGEYFLSFHCLTNYVKVAFHKGAQLDPEPPVSSKQADVRYLHVGEDDALGDQFVDWVKKASALPGEKM